MLGSHHTAEDIQPDSFSLQYDEMLIALKFVTLSQHFPDPFATGQKGVLQESQGETEHTRKPTKGGRKTLSLKNPHQACPA